MSNSGKTESPFLARLRAVYETISRSGQSTRLLELNAATFMPMVGQPFDAESGGGATISLLLEQVSERNPPYELPGRKPFALLFSGPGDAVLQQGTYRLSHRTLGALEIFVVPLGPDDMRRMRYQAVFG